MTDLVTIVGGGHAAGELATALRQGGYTGAVRLIGEEIYLPYQRPPLSKAFLAGEIDAEGLLLKSRATYEKAQVETVLGRRVDKLDRASKTLRFADGSSEAYDKLVLATGGRPRRLAAVGIERAEQCSNFHYLRTIDDVRRIHSQFRAGMKLVIVGGGYIGLEVAAVARKRGIEVTVLEAQERVLARVTAPEVSAFYERVHGEAGVVLKTSTVVKEIHLDESSDAVAALECVGGEVIRADVVIVGVGLTPNVELAREAGLEENDGIVVDAYCQTTDDSILAIGDCTRHPSVYAGRPLRLESVPNAVEQARTAALAITGQHKPYEAVPWFWSEQYDLRLQMVGLSQGYDQMVFRGSAQTRSFTAFYLREGCLIAADAISRPQEFMLARQAVSRGARPDPALLADESVTLKTVLA
jgi:3-phenylpropionate/trans-cinnamate dioxygenase ferredoxin reductase component